MVVKSLATHAEVVKSIQADTYPTYFEYKCQFTVNGLVIDTLKTVEIDIAEDYANGYGAAIIISVAMILDDYMQKVYPNRNALTCTLVKKAVTTGVTAVTPLMSTTVEYSVVPLDNVDMAASAKVNFDGKLGIGTFKFQLIPLPLEKLRLETVSGVYPEAAAIDVLKVLLGNATRKRATNSSNAFTGFAATEPPKEIKVKPQLIIKPTNVLDLPTYLQKHCGGIYNHGIGCYFYNTFWYIYPLYDCTRYDRAKRTLDIAVLPQQQTIGIDKTYAYVNNRAFILITAEFQETDNRDVKMLNKGNGVRFSNATVMFDEFTTRGGNKATTDITKNVSQFVLSERETGDQYAPFSDNEITDNVAQELSKLSARMGTEVTMRWKYANPDILYPGMPVKVHFPVEGGVKERLGVLLAIQTYGRTLQPEMTAMKVGMEVALKLFLAD